MSLDPWQNDHIGKMSPSALAALGRYAIKLLARRGVTIPAGNRLQKAVELLDSRNAAAVPVSQEDPIGALRLAEAFRTAFEAFFVMWTSTEAPV